MISDNIRIARSQKNLTQTALSKALGISRASVSQFEAGRAKPSIAVLTKMVKVLDTTYDFLIEGKGPVNPSPETQKDLTSLRRDLEDIVFRVRQME